MHRRAVIIVTCGVLASVMLWAGVAGAQTAAQDQYAQEPQTPQITALENQVKSQNVLLNRRADQISAVGSKLKEAQTQATAAQAQAGELRKQTEKLQNEYKTREQTLKNSKAAYENRAATAYKGGEVGDFASVLSGILGLGNSKTNIDARTLQILFDGRQSLDEYQKSQDYLKNTVWQLDQSRKDYQKARDEQKSQSEELQKRRAELDNAIAQIQSDQKDTRTRLQGLRASERARIQSQSPASGITSSIPASKEARIAQNIVARPVAPISKKAYEKLYKKAAKEYGFGEDWYILAAVGKVESNHGENMGPSSAGALGPMQFLPSTWETAGVDGNGDGVANIMDPRDAIPAAARYLRDGGAPDDWYAALYSYNHADWYVREVLGVAESYRQMAHDNTVGPYTRIKPAH